MRRHNACPEASALIQSLQYRDMSLGLTSRTLTEIEKDLHAACSPEQPFYESHRCSSRYRSKDQARCRLHCPPPTASRTGMPSGTGSMLSRVGEVAYRMGQYAIAILYRMGVVPVQVASLVSSLCRRARITRHLRALPLSSILFGRRVVMPIQVHEAYYPSTLAVTGHRRAQLQQVFSWLIRPILDLPGLAFPWPPYSSSISLPVLILARLAQCPSCSRHRFISRRKR